MALNSKLYQTNYITVICVMLNMYMVVHMQNSRLLLMNTDASLRFTFW